MKYVHVFDGEIVDRYEEDTKKNYGGPWVHGESFEVPLSIKLNHADFKNGKVIEKTGVKEEALAMEAKAKKKDDAKRALKNIDFDKVTTVAALKTVVANLIESLEG